jgi:hypothetical protein
MRKSYQVIHRECDFGLEVKDIPVFGKWRVNKMSAEDGWPPSMDGIIVGDKAIFSLSLFLANEMLMQEQADCMQSGWISIHDKRLSDLRMSLQPVILGSPAS